MSVAIGVGVHCKARERYRGWGWGFDFLARPVHRALVVSKTFLSLAYDVQLNPKQKQFLSWIGELGNARSQATFSAHKKFVLVWNHVGFTLNRIPTTLDTKVIPCCDNIVYYLFSLWLF